MWYRFPSVYASKSKMSLGSLTLFHHMSPLLSCRFRYLKLIKLVTSGPDHAMRYESVDMVCAHDILGLIFLRGNTVGAYCDLFEGEHSRGLLWYYLFLILKSENFFLPPLTLSHVRLSLTPFLLPSLLFSHSVLRSVIPHSHRSCVEFRAAKHSLVLHHSCHDLAASDRMRHGTRAGVWLAFHLC